MHLDRKEVTLPSYKWYNKYTPLPPPPPPLTPDEAKIVEQFGLKNNHGVRKQQCIYINALTYFNELFIGRIEKEGIVVARGGIAIRLAVKFTRGFSAR